MVTINLCGRLMLPKKLITVQRNYGSMTYSRLRQSKDMRCDNIFNMSKNKKSIIPKHLNNPALQDAYLAFSKRQMSSFPSFSTNKCKGINRTQNN